METGPLARVLVTYLDSASESNALIKGVVDDALAKLGLSDPTVLISLLGRVAARNLEASVACDLAFEWINELLEVLRAGNAEFWAPYNAKNGQGTGLWEAPRGAVSHSIVTKGGRIDRYQVVTPSTWILAPRADDGTRGAMEEALVGTPLKDVERPIEAARIVRSFDP
jgi:hydrogenase large subunit